MQYFKCNKFLCNICKCKNCVMNIKKKKHMQIILQSIFSDGNVNANNTIWTQENLNLISAPKLKSFLEYNNSAS